MLRFVSTKVAVAAAVVALAGSAAAWFACQDGPAAGDWDLPSGSGTSDGFIDGKLIDPVTNTGLYQFLAVLTDVPTPCLSCIAGTIDGTLDDGVGPGPDYIVIGEYTGHWLSGRGSFEAKIVPPGSNTSVGIIKGDFSDPPGVPGIGSFEGSWEICP
jgi:hypothetical protein